MNRILHATLPLVVVLAGGCGGGAATGTEAKASSAETSAAAKADAPVAAKTASAPTTSYRAALDAMVAEIKSNPKIKVTKANAAPPATRAEMDAVEQRLHVSDKLLALWSEMNGADLTWEGPLGSKGNLHIPKIDAAFNNENLYQKDDPPDAPLRKFYILDNFAPGNPDWVGIVLDGTDDPPVFFLSNSVDLRPLGCRLSEYLPLVAKTRAFDYWPEAVVVDQSKDRNDSSMSSIAFRLLMPQVFPGFALGSVLHGDYHARDEERMTKARDTIARITSAFTKASVSFTTTEADAAVGTIAFKIKKDPANVKKARDALVKEVDGQWKALDAKQGAMSFGDVRIELGN